MTFKRHSISWSLLGLVTALCLVGCKQDESLEPASDAGDGSDVGVVEDASTVPDLDTAPDVASADLGGQPDVALDADVPDAADASDVAPDLGPPPPLEVLLYSETRGVRHPSIADALPAIEQLGVTRGFNVTMSEDSAIFTDATVMDGIDVVVFVSTTGDVLDDTEQAAFEAWFRSGRGWFGIHSAADTEYGWAWYGGLVGTYFKSHPSQQDATAIVEDAEHPATAHLGATWTRRDEWYDFRTNPRPDVRVLLALDESSYVDHTMDGDDHPIAWCHEYDGGRSIYTGGGHTSASFVEPEFLDHIAGAILWAGGRVAGDCTPR